MRQPAFVPLIFVALQSNEAQRRFPGVDALKPGEQLLVISDQGAVYRGADAWIMCLWALENYREHAQRLAHPVLLPLARYASCSRGTGSSCRIFCFDKTRKLRRRSWLLITLCTRLVGKASVAPDENVIPWWQVKSASFFVAHSRLPVRALSYGTTLIFQ